jgi:hypothetical protein
MFLTGPDVYPFTGKKNSAMVGTFYFSLLILFSNVLPQGMTNAKEALKIFAIPTIVATAASDERNINSVQKIIAGGHSSFFNNAFVFPPS